jgi:hypothetical protein
MNLTYSLKLIHIGKAFSLALVICIFYIVTNQPNSLDSKNVSNEHFKYFFVHEQFRTTVADRYEDLKALVHGFQMKNSTGNFNKTIVRSSKVSNPSLSDMTN